MVLLGVMLWNAVAARVKAAVHDASPLQLLPLLNAINSRLGLVVSESVNHSCVMRSISCSLRDLSVLASNP